MEISFVPGDFLDRYWGVVEELLEKSVKFSNGRWNTEALWKGIKDGTRQLWIAFEGNTVYAAVVTSIEHYPEGKWLNYQMVGGYEMEKWYDKMAEVLEDFGRKNNCIKIETVCRPGFTKRHAKGGFRPTHIVMEKDLWEVEKAATASPQLQAAL